MITADLRPRGRVHVVATMIATAISLLPALAASAAAAPVRAPFEISEIPTLGGSTSAAFAINDRGEVAGSAEASFTVEFLAPPPEKVQLLLPHAFRLSDGSLTDIEEPPEPGYSRARHNCFTCSAGYAINGHGDVAGFSVSGSGDLAPVIWPAAGGTTGVSGGGLEPKLFGINDRDEVVGGASSLEDTRLSPGSLLALGAEDPGGANPLSSSGSLGAFLSAPAPGGGRTVTELELAPPTERASAVALGINDRGEVVGSAEPAEFAGVHAFLYADGTMHDLGTLGGIESGATAINERGALVGWSLTADGVAHAFIYDRGRTTDLGALPGGESVAYAVNDRNEVAGSSEGHAFLDRRGLITDLNTLLPPESGWTLVTANGINDAGEIVGTGFHDGVQRGFLLRPGRDHHPPRSGRGPRH